MIEDQNIRWTCDACGEDVADGLGYIVVSHVAVNQQRENTREWHEMHPKGPLGERDVVDLMTMPEDVPWHIYHYDCDPNPDDDTYTIHVSQARTPLKVLAWTLHLMGKNWIDNTNWVEFVGKATGADVSKT